MRRPWFVAVVATIATTLASACEQKIQSDPEVQLGPLGANDEISNRIVDQAHANLTDSIITFSLLEMTTPPEPEHGPSDVSTAALTTTGGGSAMPGESNSSSNEPPILGGTLESSTKLDLGSRSGAGQTKAKTPTEISEQERRRRQDTPVGVDTPRSAAEAEREDPAGTGYSDPVRKKKTPAPVSPIAPAETRDPRR